MAGNKNRYLKGSSGRAWINDDALETLTNIELKVKGEFSDHNFCGDSSTYSSFEGWSGEGTVTMTKSDSKVWIDVANGYLEGIMPNIVLNTCLTDKVSGKSERVRVSGITVTEFDLVKFKAKETTELELPIKFSNYKILEYID